MLARRPSLLSAGLLLVSLSLVCVADSSTDHLNTAVRNGNEQAVRDLVARGADVNSSDDLGNTPLLYAAMGTNTAVSLCLLSFHADPNVLQPETGYSALHYAVIHGDSVLVRALLHARTNPELHAAGRPDALHLAAAQSSSEIVAELLSTGVAVDEEDNAGITALELAVQHNRLDIAKVLLQAGAQAQRAHGIGNRSLLHLAAMQDSSGVIPALVSAGADPTARDQWGETPLDLALAYKNRRVVFTLLHLPDPANKLHDNFSEVMERAVVRGRTEVVAMLLDAGWDVNGMTPDKSFYLNDAALKGQLRVARLLLERGARLDSRNAAGGTPLHDAVISGNADLVAFLLDRGCPLESPFGENRTTPLMLAVELDHQKVVALLLKRGADPLARDTSGRSALDRAVELQDLSLTKLLKASGTPVS